MPTSVSQLKNILNSAGTGPLFEQSTTDYKVFKLTEDCSHGDGNGKVNFPITLGYNNFNLSNNSGSNTNDSNTIFDGNGKTITGLNSGTPAPMFMSNLQLNGSASNIIIKNFRVEIGNLNANIYGQPCGAIGAYLLGENNTNVTIQNCIVNCTGGIPAYNGGITGRSTRNVSILNCIANFPNASPFISQKGGVFGADSTNLKANHCIVNIGTANSSSTNLTQALGYLNSETYANSVEIRNNIVISPKTNSSNTFTNRSVSNASNNIYIHPDNAAVFYAKKFSSLDNGNGEEGSEPLEKYLQRLCQEVFKTYYNTSSQITPSLETTMYFDTATYPEMEFFLSGIADVFSQTRTYLDTNLLTLKSFNYSQGGSTIDSGIRILEGSIQYSSANTLKEVNTLSQFHGFLETQGTQNQAELNAIQPSDAISTTLGVITSQQASITSMLAEYDDGTENDLKSYILTYCADNNLQWDTIVGNTTFRAGSSAPTGTILTADSSGIDFTKVSKENYFDMTYELGYQLYRWRNDTPGATPGQTSTSVSLQQIGADIDGEAANDRSGYSVSLSDDGTRVAIGAIYNDAGLGLGLNAGHVRVYQWNGSQWEQIGSDIDGEAQTDFWGDCVSLSGDGNLLAVSSTSKQLSNTTNRGKVIVYEWTGAQWQQKGSSFEANDFVNYVGKYVSINSNRIAFGNHYAEDMRGTIRVWEWSGSDWQQTNFSGGFSTADGTNTRDFFGWCVSLDGDLVAASSKHGNYVKIFEWNGSEWSQKGSTITGSRSFGVSISLSGMRVAIGASADQDVTLPGEVLVYEWSDSASNWVKLGNTIGGSSGGDRTGCSVSLDGNKLAVGDKYYDQSSNDNRGRVRVFEWANNQWNKLFEVLGDAANDYLGGSVSLKGDKFAVGANGHDGAEGADSGHTKIFEFPTVTTLLGHTLDQYKATLTNSSQFESLEGFVDDYNELKALREEVITLYVMTKSDFTQRYFEISIEGDEVSTAATTGNSGNESASATTTAGNGSSYASSSSSIATSSQK